MVDWRMVTGNGLWILGLSMLLALYSFASWLASVSHRSRREVSADPWIRVSSAIALGAVLAGWIWTQADRWPERVIGVALIGMCAWKVAAHIRTHRRADRH
jgi:hypothetical protein